MCHTKNKYNIQELLPPLIGLAFAILYASYLSKMHYVDGLLWAHNIENLPLDFTWHQHHPIWVPTMLILFKIIKVILPELRSMVFLSLANSVLGGIAVFLLIRIVYRLTKNNLTAILTGLFLGTSWGMMNFCTDSNIYITVLVFMLWIIDVLFRNVTLSRRNAIYATILIIISSLMHQISFFFTLVVLAAIITRSQKKDRFQTSIICTVLYSVVTVSVNYLIFLRTMLLLNNEIIMSFPQWLTAYAAETSWWTIIHNGFIYGMQTLCYTITNSIVHLPGSELLRHAVKFEESMFSSLYLLFYFFMVIFILLEIFQLKKAWRSFNALNHTRLLLLIWFGVYFIFNHFFCAFELHYKLFYITPLLILLSLRLHKLPKKYRLNTSFAVLGIVIVLFTWNLFSGLIPNSKPENNRFLLPVTEIAQHVKKGDFIIFARDEFYIAWLARYYTDADVEIHRNAFNKYAVLNCSNEDLYSRTIEFMDNRYKRIFLTNREYTNFKGSNYCHMSALFLKPPHPWRLLLIPSNVTLKNNVKSGEEIILYEVSLSDASHDN